MKRKRKGQYGYIDYMKKYSAVRTLIWFLIAFAIFFCGIFYFKTRSNIFTVAAVLLMLPSSKSLVNFIMFMRFKTPGGSFHERADAIIEKYNFSRLLTFYDSVLTIEKGKSYQYDFFMCHEGSLIGFTQNEKRDNTLIEKHLRQMLKKNDIKNVAVKLFDNEDMFLKRMEELVSKYKAVDEEKLLEDSEGKETTGYMRDVKAIVLISALSL